jgi:hypothetical protein
MRVVYKFVIVDYRAVELAEEQLTELAADGYMVEALTSNRDSGLVLLRKHAAE